MASGSTGSATLAATDDLKLTESSSPAEGVSRFKHAVSQQYQYVLDKTVPYILYRWIVCFVVAFIYVLRIYFVEGFYLITYAIGIYLLNLIMAFLSPQEDPETSADGPTLPSRGSDEYRPFVRRLPEFNFWFSITRAILIGFVMTFFDIFDVPVFWPILLSYWLMLVVITMRKQIQHMIKYRYVPFSVGKQQYGKKEPLAETSEL